MGAAKFNNTQTNAITLFQLAERLFRANGKNFFQCVRDEITDFNEILTVHTRTHNNMFVMRVMLCDGAVWYPVMKIMSDATVKYAPGNNGPCFEEDGYAAAHYWASQHSSSAEFAKIASLVG